MATKSGIIAYITARWGDITSPKRVPLLDREVSNAIVEELYPDSFTDSNITETYTTKSGTDIIYSIRIIKSGNIAHIKGTLRNTTSGVLSPRNIFLWKNNELRPKTGVNDILFKAFNGAGSVDLFVSNNVLSVSTNFLPSSANFVFDFKTYITQD